MGEEKNYMDNTEFFVVSKPSGSIIHLQFNSLIKSAQYDLTAYFLLSTLTSAQA